MKKNYPSIREVNAAQDALQNKIRERAKAVFKKPTYEDDRLWREAHPSPSERYARKFCNAEKVLRAKADEILLEGRMGQITSDEFYAKVKAF